MGAPGEIVIDRAAPAADTIGDLPIGKVLLSADRELAIPVASELPPQRIIYDVSEESMRKVLALVKPWRRPLFGKPCGPCARS